MLVIIMVRALHFAAGEGQVNVLEWLVSHGANINARDNDGWEPVHIAAGTGK